MTLKKPNKPPHKSILYRIVCLYYLYVTAFPCPVFVLLFCCCFYFWECTEEDVLLYWKLVLNEQYNGTKMCIKRKCIVKLWENVWAAFALLLPPTPPPNYSLKSLGVLDLQRMQNRVPTPEIKGECKFCLDTRGIVSCWKSLTWIQTTVSLSL